MSRVAPQRRIRRGSYALEFALTLPVWWMIMVAIMEFGWLFLHQSTLDSAATVGCRAGALHDPGRADAHLHDVENAATDEMAGFMSDMGVDVCDECEVNAWTTGQPPQRSLICEATWEISSLTGIMYDRRLLVTRQLSRLEWQRTAAPE